MLKLVLLAFTISGLCSPLFADSGASEYYDQAAWEKVVANGGTVSRDNFNTNSVSLPGVSVASYIGYNGLYAGTGQFIDGTWVDKISKYGYTMWTFSKPVYAFGAHFEMDVQDGLEFFSGLNLSMPNDKLPYRNDGRKRRFDGFYGFISGTPIRSLMISWGSDGPPCACYGQSYTMDHLEVSTTPINAATPKPSIH